MKTLDNISSFNFQDGKNPDKVLSFLEMLGAGDAVLWRCDWMQGTSRLQGCRRRKDGIVGVWKDL
jgi:hypothetical protein